VLFSAIEGYQVHEYFNRMMTLMDIFYGLQRSPKYYGETYSPRCLEEGLRGREAFSS
jgi:hypothetical protein